jgi:hypothetical protein
MERRKGRIQALLRDWCVSSSGRNSRTHWSTWSGQ